MRFFAGVRFVAVFCLLVSAACCSLRAQSVRGFAHTRGAELLDGQGRPLLLRGTNLGNWLEPEGYMFLFNDGGPSSPREIEDYVSELIGPTQAKRFWRDYRDAYVTRADIDLLQSTGMNSMRVPIHYKFFAEGNDEGFRLLDRVIEWAKEDGMYVIIDMHEAPGGQTGTNIDDSYGYPWLYDSPADQQELIAIWKRIAAHYREEPAVLGYDLLNEPVPHYPELQRYNRRLEPLYRRISAAIREVDKHHVLILGGARWDTDFTVFGPPFDGNVMYELHLYQFDTPWSPSVAKQLNQYTDFRDKYHVPIWLGESGENSDDWVRHFREELESRRIGWCFWPYKKMEESSAIISFAKPDPWDEIVAYAKIRRGVGNAEKQIRSRPSLDVSAAAMKQLLANVRLGRCRLNSGYVRALGLHPPAGDLPASKAE